MPPDQRTLDQLSLSREEYERIIDLLDREPNEVELGMFGALWSEHCGYKNSRPLLKMFPTEGAYVLTKAGEENAGVVDIGDGLGVAFKIESHNHPSAIEPYEGAATGVGGIVRDIFAMGARPIALLDSLRFGPLQPPRRSAERLRDNGKAAETILSHEAFETATTPEVAARNRHLFNGVVAGIGGYGNCIGIPTVGGEVSFSASYSGNPLVNAMCVGVGRIDRLVKARADGPGNLLMLVGADTGRDGIHGATFASVQLDETSEERRPAVQVGNPFLEKLLMEACLQLTEEHGEWIAGLQDCGAAGLTSAAVECAAKAGTGIIIDVAKVPRREKGMTPYEVMLSESQERMLVIVKPEHEADVRALFEHWELQVATIGIVTDDGLVRIRDGDVEVVRVPAKVLTDAPTYVREGLRPAWMDDVQAFDSENVTDINRLERNGNAPWNAVATGASARASGVAGDRVEAHRVAAVRPPGRDEHGGRARIGRRDRAHQGHEQGAGHVHRRQRRVHVPRSVHRWRDRRGGGSAKRRLHGREADRDDQLPQLRESREAGGLLPAQGSDTRHVGRRAGARHPRHQRQREPIQRDEWRGDLAHAGCGDGRAPRRR